MSMIPCSECDQLVSDQASACPKCGYPLNRNHTATVMIPQQKSRGIAAALALFLGGFGAHKFYLNKPGIGVLYALFFWTFIPAILGLVATIRYIMMSDEEFQEKYTNKKL